MQNLKNRRLLLNVIIAILFLSIGFISGKLYDVFPIIQVDKQFELFDVLSLVTTVGVAYWISVYFFGKNNISAAEKELLFKQIEELSLFTNESMDVILMNSPLVTEVVSKFKILRKKINRLNRLADKVSVGLKEEIFQQYSEQLKSIHRLATLTPNYSQEEAQSGFNDRIQIRVLDNRFEYSDSRLKEIDAELDKLSDLLFDIQIEIINRCKA